MYIYVYIYIYIIFSSKTLRSPPQREGIWVSANFSPAHLAATPRCQALGGKILANPPRKWRLLTAGEII